MLLIILAIFSIRLSICISTIYKIYIFAHKKGGNHPTFGAISTFYYSISTPSEWDIRGLLKKLAPVGLLARLLGVLKDGSVVALLTLLLLLLKIINLWFRSALAARSTGFADNLTAVGARRFVGATTCFVTLHLVGRTLSAIHHYGAIAYLGVAHLLQDDVAKTLGHFKE